MAEYIEREAIIQKFADLVKRSNNSDFAPVPTWNQAVQIVYDSPAADVRPVVRGAWIALDLPRINAKRVECSKCHNGMEVDYMELVKATYNFCPNCGADMREVSE